MERRPENIDQSPEQRNGRFLNNGKDNARIVILVLSTVAALLAIVLIVGRVRSAKLIRELNVEKEELTGQIISLRADFDSLSSDYEDINAQLDTSKEQINQLLERIRVTDATNRQQIRKYQKELGTLRSIMRNYIVQIDSLNTLNHRLTVAAAAARREAATVKQQNEELQKSVDDLSGKVEVAAVIRGRNLKVAAYNKNGKTVNRCADAKYLMVSLSLIENAIAPKGPMRVYVAITDPSGKLMKNENSGSFSFKGKTIGMSASREVDYQGAEVDMGIYFKQDAKFPKGVYTVRAFSESMDFGSVQMMLR